MTSGEHAVAGGGPGHEVRRGTAVTKTAATESAMTGSTVTGSTVTEFAAAESRDRHRVVVRTVISFAFCEVALVTAGVVFVIVSAPMSGLYSALVILGAAILAFVLTGIVLPFFREGRGESR